MERFGCDKKQIYPYRRRRPLEWKVAKTVAFLEGRTEYGVWRLACITYASPCLYSIDSGIEAGSTRYWMIVPDWSSASKWKPIEVEQYIYEVAGWSTVPSRPQPIL